MTSRVLAAMVTGAAAVALASCGGSSETGVRVAASEAAPPRGAVEKCSTRSEASFPGAFSDPDNLVVGPLVLVGAAAYTPPEVVREFGGNKFPVLVRAGHRVTVAVPRRTRALASLGYGPLPEGVELTPRDGHRAVTFVACRRGTDSGSSADGAPVTFWSGFVLVAAPRCVPLSIWVDDDRSPRRRTLRLGVARCR